MPRERIDLFSAEAYLFHASYSACAKTCRTNSICVLKWIAAMMRNLLPPTSKIERPRALSTALKILLSSSK